MTRYMMSLEKYQYLLDEIDFLDFIFTEQKRKNSDTKINPTDMARFLTNSVILYDTEGNRYVDQTLYKNQEEYKKELQTLKENITGYESKGNNDKVLHFLNQLIGSLNVEVLEDKLMLATLLDYVEYHKSLKDEKAKQR